ncbi:unnamed protein product [Rhizoctonia solani]|uniref:Uncharacterized protein n=2 Tax=Rhizoctonia solani TaxID=456999 RepID=A0A8H2WGC1_9AGAM
MVSLLWGYYLNREELLAIYKECGGTLGTFNPGEMKDLQHARRAISHWIMPTLLNVWYTNFDLVDDGFVFYIGKPDCPNLRDAIKPSLATRCTRVFKRAPDQFRFIEGHWYMVRDEKKHRLRMMERMRSNRDGDMYPLTVYDLPDDQKHLVKLGSKIYSTPK